jgi:hypothetical protein
MKCLQKVTRFYIASSLPFRIACLNKSKCHKISPKTKEAWYSCILWWYLRDRVQSSCYLLNKSSRTLLFSYFRKYDHGGILNVLGLPRNQHVILHFEDRCRLHLILHEIGRIAADSPKIFIRGDLLQLLSYVTHGLPILLLGWLKLIILSISVSWRSVELSNVFCLTSICDI